MELCPGGREGGKEVHSMPSKGVEFSRRGKALPLEEGHEFFQGKEHTQDVHVGGLIPGEGDLLRKGVCSGEQVSPPPSPHGYAPMEG